MQEQLERRRRAVAERWNLDSEVVLIGAGEPLPVPGRADRTYPFRSHSEYFYFTDSERPGGVLAFDPQEGWVDFVAPVTKEELLWSGGVEGRDGGVPVTELPAWLEARKGRRIGVLGAPVSGAEADAELEPGLRYELNDVRRRKDEVELERMRAAERATSAGFAAVQPLLRPGVSEREVQIELEAEFFRAGADFLGFDTIVAGGPNTAVLHFAPTARAFGEGELVLIDAGAEVQAYSSDITRTYSASGMLDPEQAELHALVRAAGVAATQASIAGTEWRDVHRKAALVIGEGLVDFGLLRGEPGSLLEQGAVTIFFPHGIGHMVGLGIRDAGDVLEGRDGMYPGYPRLRFDRPLEPGHVVTVEPGIYFVPSLLRDRELRGRHRDTVDWERTDRMLDFGGIRIEDNVLVTEDGFEVLTADVPVLP
ncbi:MAG: M24 family metallopeptidase [Actinobacteria bacterium]|nr:MAG: M24 family metallopeptidase [Actinomycetota bacterium]